MAETNGTAARGTWSTQLGFILAATGSAVGLGSIWRFPYIVHMHGGAAFSLIYIVCIVLVGLPIMWAEIYIGKKTGRDPVGAFKSIMGGSRAWSLVGAMGVLAGFLILSFYTVVTGWVLHYLIYAIPGMINGLTVEQYGQHMGDFMADPAQQIWYHAAVAVLIALIVVVGVQKGIERANNMLMPALVGLMTLLMVYALASKAGWEAIRYTFLDVDFSKLRADSVLVALGHSFFTLSLGMGAMITYGSYMRKDEQIMPSGMAIVTADTAISFMSCLIVFPILFSFKEDVVGGPKLIFVTLPPLFDQLAGGRILSVIFYALLLFAAMASAISLLEVIVAYLIDEDKFSRKQAVIIAAAGAWALGIPSALSFGVLSKWAPGGKTFFDWVDYISSNWMLVVGGLFIAIAAGWLVDEKDQREELTQRWPRAYPLFRFTLRYITPVLVILVILQTAGVIKFEQ